MDFPAFAVACGEEGSDPWVPFRGSVVRVDEYDRSGHLHLLEQDLADVAALGVRVWRYGMPWRLTEPEPGRYDWRWWDRALAACEAHGLEPVVDLCHFGLPDHYPGFCDPAWVEGFYRYVDAFLARYPGPRWFTPVNEPGITATMSGLLGVWNDARASEADYVTALGHVALANLEALARVRADRDGWWIGAEGFGCELVDDGDEAGAAEAARARGLQQLVWDLHLGVDAPPEVAGLCEVLDDGLRQRLADLTGVVPADRIVAGHDMYPISATAYGTRATRPLSIADRVAAYEQAAARWHRRYELPFWVAETSNLGLAVEDGPEWLDALVGGLDRLADRGLPVRGICWYSRGDQYDWDLALTEPVGRVTTVGLFDTERRPRPVAAAYGALARARARASGLNQVATD
jgi:beta-glucosidase/6-phospho-beta-glucosidase/beta-galactosidase